MTRKKKQNPPKGNRSYKIYSEKYAAIFLFLLLFITLADAFLAITIPNNPAYIYFDKFATIFAAPIVLFMLGVIFGEIDKINDIYK
ncbi:hypothetical protein [Ligilactobacillus apodemi]|uniref:hypothetical protein n=1 Tax=Ligilactobacillus apodemi TaxID=307126 RepID=UPI00214C959A|nr:hypothetical protein [Ligilactobacillus apodemi]MCR1900910.1 hypothetical protein [Ligilactobacillus apodemi]